MERANRPVNKRGIASINPARTILGGVPETGITFGIGTHACLGKNLAAGNLVRSGNLPDESHQYGTVAWIAHALLQAGVQKHPEHPPELDQTIDRETWLRYPVCFNS